MSNVPSGNFRVGRRDGWIPDIVVFHTTGLGTAQAGINTVRDPASGVSYHFIIAANGAVTSLVGIADTAFANGTGSGNLAPSHSTNAIVRSRTANANDYTISVAFGDMDANSGRLTTAQINAAATLLSSIRESVRVRWNHRIDITRTTVIGHNEVTPRYSGGGSRSCPNLPATRNLQFPFTQILQRFNELPLPG